MQAGNMPFVLDLGASLTVERAASLKDELAAALAGQGGVRLSFSSVEEIDLSCLQVLCAALRSAKASGKDLHFTGTLSRRVAERLRSCGFLRDESGPAEGLEAALAELS
jgi:anti-anti-sigma regulatory factor